MEEKRSKRKNKSNKQRIPLAHEKKAIHPKIVLLKKQYSNRRLGRVSTAKGIDSTDLQWRLLTIDEGSQYILKTVKMRIKMKPSQECCLENQQRAGFKAEFDHYVIRESQFPKNDCTDGFQEAV